MTTDANTTNTSSGQASALEELSNLFTDFSKNMQTTIKKTPRVPTAAEFLSDFDNAFNTRLSDLGGFGGGLGPNEMEFARNVLMPALFMEYQGRLGDIAKTGQSPFITAPGGSSYQSSTSTGTSTSKTSGTTSTSGQKSTVGSGGDGSSSTNDASFSEDTNVNRSETENFNNNESQTITEDILLPKVMPLDFLKEALTPAAIRVAYEGSRRGAGQFQSSGTGATIARRV